MEYVVIIKEVTEKAVRVYADSLEQALNEAESGNYSDLGESDNEYLLEQDEWQVVTPSGEIVDVEEALDRESLGDRIGE